MFKQGLAIIACVGISATALSAQGKDPVSAGFMHQFSGDLDNGGEVSIDRWNVSFGAPLVKRTDGFIALTANLSYLDYHFSDTFDPWGEVRMASIGMPARFKLTDKWTLASVFRLGLAAETGADTDEAYTWGIVSSLDYKVNEKLTIGPGISFYKQLEDGDSVFPIISVRWDFADRWSLRTGPSEGANAGANIYVKHEYSDQWNFLAGVFAQNQQFRLSKTNATAPDGVGEETNVSVYGVVKYFASDKLSVSFIGGYSFGNEYNVFDATGATVTEQEGDAAPFVGVRLNYEF